MVDVNEPVTNPALVEAINKFQEKPAKNKEKILLEELAKAHFLAPVDITPCPELGDEDNMTTLKVDSTSRFQMITNVEDISYFLAFTDWDELGKWQQKADQQTMVLTFDDLVTLVMQDNSKAEGFVINPYGQNMIMDKASINTIKNPPKTHEQTIEKDTTVTIGEPANYPHELAAAVKRHAKKKREIKKIHLLLMIKEGEESFLLVVDFVGDRRKVFDGIAEVAIPCLKKGQLLDLITADDNFGQNAIKGKKPMYKRGLLCF